MSLLIELSSDLLKAMYNDKLALFSYSTRISNGRYISEYDHPLAMRYSINTLAGIQLVEKHGARLWDFDFLLEEFLKKQGQNVDKASDHGFLLSVLTEARHDRANAQFQQVKSIVENKEYFLKLTLQDVCWILSGLVSHARETQDCEVKSTVQKAFRLIIKHFYNPDTLLPHHSLQFYRRRFVSFGGITYFLKAMAEYSLVFGDEYARTLFSEGVRLMLDLQGPQGEWAWFYDTNRARIVDWYEVYSVHQEAMAMLFLLPAYDMGIVGVETAIIKSYQWLFGNNELSTPMMVDQPFFSYRSIRRKKAYERGKRYVRSMLLSSLGLPARPLKADALEINTECRSYEMGWTLYAWAGRNEFPEFTELHAFSRPKPKQAMALL